MSVRALQKPPATPMWETSNHCYRLIAVPHHSTSGLILCSLATAMSHKKREISICCYYSRDLKRRIIYQSTVLGKGTTKIAKSLDINLRVVQRVMLTWNEIGEVCRDRTRNGQPPIMARSSVDVCITAFDIYI